jgi:predicted RND superfamily exporter protein
MVDHAGPPDLSSRIAHAIVGSRRRAVWIVVCVLMIAAAALSYGRRIKIDTNLEALLAPSSPSVEALDELRARQGSTDLLNIAVQSDDPAANRRLVEDILAAVRTWPEVEEASIDRDYTPIRDHSLYYLELEDLQSLHDRLRFERQKAIGKKLSVGGTFDPRAIVDDDWDDEGEDDEDDEDDEDPSPDGEDTGERDKDIRELMQEQREKLAASGRVTEADLDVIWPAENPDGEIVWAEQVGRAIASRDGRVALVQARLTAPATDVEFAGRINEKIEALFVELDVESYAPGMLAKVGGAYSTAREARAIIKDLGRATWLSAGLVAFVLIAGFRNLRGLVVVLVSLLVGVLVTVALARAALGELNVLTAFLFAVLFGIGVDFAIHLYTQRERHGPTPDWAEVVRDHMRPLAASMLTTFGSFFILLFADFQGFREFGLIAGAGVLVSFAAAIVMVPALDVALGPLRRAPPPPELPLEVSGAVHRAPLLRWALLLAMGALGAYGARGVAFERDMRELRREQTEAEQGIGYQRALADTERTGTAIALLADTPEQLDAAISALEPLEGAELIPGSDKHWVLDVIGLRTHLPTDQERKVPILRRIADLAGQFAAEIPDMAEDAPARRYLTHLRALERLASADPLEPDALPEWAKRLFREKDGSIGKVGLLYVDVASYDLEQITWVTRRFREVVDGTGIRGASTRFILGDLTMDVETDAGRLPLLALLAILVMIAFDLRKPWPVLITFASLCGGLLLTFGVMGVWPIRINFYNLVVMPAVVGLGIDASIHLWHARRLGAVSATSKAALLSALTTAGGFAGLLVATHGGLRSIGLLGTFATLSCVVVALVALGWPRRMPGPR